MAKARAKTTKRGKIKKALDASARPYIVAETDDAPELRGGCLSAWQSRSHEVVLSGPYQTGKTFALLLKLHTLLCINPNCQALMVRGTRKAILSTAVVTYMRKTLPFPPKR